MTLRLAVSGATGRMGRAIARLADEAQDVELVGGVARTTRTEDEAVRAGYPRVVGVDDAASDFPDADVVVDVSAPAQLEALVRGADRTLEGRALVVGTTGLGADLERSLDGLAERVPLLVAANFSPGVNVLLALAERAAAALPADGWDVEIVEAHHRHKADAPSGTAIALGQAVAAGRGGALPDARTEGRSGHSGERPTGDVAFHSLRGGEVVGEHTVLFLGARERLELTHRAMDRSVFAAGALAAARWLAGREPGRYTMRDVLGL